MSLHFFLPERSWYRSSLTLQELKCSPLKNTAIRPVRQRLKILCADSLFLDMRKGYSLFSVRVYIPKEICRDFDISPKRYRQAVLTMELFGYTGGDMKTLIFVVLSLIATAVYAACQTNTFFYEGKVVVCTTCCSMSGCNTVCN